MRKARLEGKRVIITGGSTGIGGATAGRFLAEGASVSVWGRDAENAARFEADRPDLSSVERVDVANSAAVWMRPLPDPLMPLVAWTC